MGNPYINFVKRERSKVVDELGDDVSFAEIARELGRRWGSLNDAQRSRYSDALYESDSEEDSVESESDTEDEDE